MQNFFHIKNQTIEETLSTLPTDGKRSLEPLKTLAKENGIPLNINEDQNMASTAEVHTDEADLWQCIEGEATFICGGKMVEPTFRQLPDGTEDKREIRAKEITGGSEVQMKPGDWLFISAGVPHSHRTTTMARLFIIKIPTKNTM